MTTHNILKTAVCESISGRSTLTYQLAQNNEKQTYDIRITENTGKGYFSDDWLSLNDILEQCRDGKAVTAHIINLLFDGKSVNTGGFLVAALKQECFLKVYKQSKRAYVISPESTLMADLELLANKPSKNSKSTPKTTKRGPRK